MLCASGALRVLLLSQIKDPGSQLKDPAARIKEAVWRMWRMSRIRHSSHAGSLIRAAASLIRAPHSLI